MSSGLFNLIRHEWERLILLWGWNDSEQVLPYALNALQNKGYSFVTVADCVGWQPWYSAQFAPGTRDVSAPFFKLLTQKEKMMTYFVMQDSWNCNS